MNTVETKYVKTGYESLDKALGGGLNGITFIGGAPSSGKTTLLCDIAKNVILNNQTCIFFSFETSKEQILTKISNLSKEDSFNEKTNTNLIIDDISMPNIEYIKQQSKIAKEKFGCLDLIIIDYFQLNYLLFDNDKEIEKKEKQNIKNLLDLSKELNCPILCATQDCKALQICYLIFLFRVDNQYDLLKPNEKKEKETPTINIVEIDKTSLSDVFTINLIKKDTPLC